MDEPIKILAFYLPQYHPIPENDSWWGKGFTEWTNVTRAVPLFKSHRQPCLPADLGFYDLRVPEIRELQASLAQSYGIDGFCYWHYWFGQGRRLLERPFKEVLTSGQPNFPFCLAWANQSWTGKWHGLENQILMEQLYPGKQDYIDHFHHVLPAFQDPRYIRFQQKPVFVVYTPDLLPDPLQFTGIWQELAIRHGLPGIYFIGIHYIDWNHAAEGFDAKTIHQPFHYKKTFLEKQKSAGRFTFSFNNKSRGPEVYDYGKLVASYDFGDFIDKDFIPTILPNWDNTPRSGKSGWVFQGSTPDLFRKNLSNGLKYLKNQKTGNRFLFIKSWNEWAEGNYLEPDQRWGLGYLEAVKQARRDVI